MIGQLISNYKIISVIGEGGMGVVYLAEHIHLSRKVAIKSLHKKLISNNNIKERFKNEAATLSQIEHQNIVKLYDYVEREDGLYLIMEYVEGIPLDEFIKKESGPIKEEGTIKIMDGLLSGFSYAHKKNIVHRDVKPSNVIISRDFSVVKILDFGIAKILGEDSRNLTKDGTQMGTIYYMSPEQVKGVKLDQRSDIYSLGVTLFQIITGINPYESLTTEYEIYTQITQTSLPPAKTVYPYVSDKIDYIIKKATQKNVEDRYQSCDDFINEINNHQLPTKVTTTTKNENNPILTEIKVENKSSKKPIVAVVAVIVILALGLGVYFFGGLQNYLKWKNASVLYSYASSLSMRKDTSTFSDNNKLPINIKFGDSVKVLPNINLAPWEEGKFHEVEGLVNTNYLIDSKDFRLLARILPGALIEDIERTKFRKSLLNFYKNNSITPDISEAEQQSIFDNNNTREKWGIDKMVSTKKMTSIYARKNTNGLKTDFCIIPIKNITTGIKKGILFVYENDKEVAAQFINTIDPISYADYSVFIQKLYMYNLFLKNDELLIDFNYQEEGAE